ncbi:carboxylic ester hydrolase [Favolaschia claudopus]|uniref:Carboxylic ester hydrolase n=1 Tax=Favolaschia claudopus TaxID=2862362 RepID=A0AAW0DP92_9AGAR
MLYPFLIYSATQLLSAHAAPHKQASCLSLRTGGLHLENTTILDATYISSPTTVSTPGSCQSSATISSGPLCRVYLVINTTSTSAVHAEAWLPNNWNGRFIGLGNGGTSGCIEYDDLDYTTSLNFAAIGSDNGHDGASGLPFLNHPEVINDYAFRAVHAEAVVGKQLVRAYYSKPHSHSYFIGCSSGGRQGLQAALKYPADFDGIVAGAGATDFNNLMGWSGMLGHYVGATSPDVPVTSSPAFLPSETWEVVSREILKQCDVLDGVEDGIISEPDDCDFKLDAILCSGNQTSTACLTPPQADAVRKIYSPLVDAKGNLLYPRYSPGAEADPFAATVFGGLFSALAADWYRYAVLNVTSYDFTDWSVEDVLRMDAVNPGGVATFDGDLSAFRERGGKFLAYHGRRDPLISSTNSKRVYDLIANTLPPSPNTKIPLDDFYRLFLIPGMGHCFGGIGPTSVVPGTSLVNDAEHNILLAMVKWVEEGEAPDVIVGVGEGNGTSAMTERSFCRYPMKGVWDAKEGVWVCE